MSDFSPADMAAVMNNGTCDGFGGSGFWIFALIILFAMMNGGLFGNNGNVATSADVQRATDFAALERQNNEGVAATRRGVYDVTGSVKDGFYNTLSELRDLQGVVMNGFASIKECCCETLRAIDGVNYNAAMNTASINANTTAQTQKILDALAQNKIESLQNQINQLNLQTVMCGIPRISPYGYGIVPQFAPAPACNGGF